MGKIGTFIHIDKDVATGNKALGTSFNAANYHTIKLDQPNIFGDQFAGHLGVVAVRLNTLNGTSATPKLTIRVSADANGDLTLVPDTECDISAGITTAANGYAAAAVDLDFIFGGNGFALATERTVFIHCKIDQGTANQAETYISWRE